MGSKAPLPPELEPVRDAARRALEPITPATKQTRADKNFLFDAKRTEAGRNLPPYYLVYFLLVELLGFKNIGQFEKVAWSVPIEFNGQAYLIEHRKFGLGVFAHDPDKEEDAAREIVTRIKRAVKVAEPFFDWLAAQAVASSALNVTNNSQSLFERFSYFREAYLKKAREAHVRRDEYYKEIRTRPDGDTTIYSNPAWAIREESRWLALAAIEAFFSWTEHVFIHIGILKGALKTGEDVFRLAESEWSEKYKCALDISDPTSKKHYDQLLEIRRELRNFVTHGAFGKDGQAFKFHSRAGAVPLLLPHRAGHKPYTIGEAFFFDDDTAVATIDEFIKHLWEGPRAPAELYLQKTTLPVILTNAADGTYARAMSSIEDMEMYIEHLSREVDRAANMDW